MTYSVREQDDGHWSLRANPQTYDFDPANWKVGNSSRIVKKAGWVTHADGPPSEAKK
jgi:hypothetical protein